MGYVAGGRRRTLSARKLRYSDAEQIICSVPELAAEDVQLAAIAKAKAAAKDRTAFREWTRAQWNIRERHDRECLAH